MTKNSLDNFPIVHSSQFVDDQRLAILEYMLCKIFTQVHRVVLLLDESFRVEDIGPNIKQEQGKLWTKKGIRLWLIEEELTKYQHPELQFG